MLQALFERFRQWFKPKPEIPSDPPPTVDRSSMADLVRLFDRQNLN